MECDVLLVLVPDASLDGLGGGTADGVHAVSAVVLLVVQEPAGIRQASHLDRSMPQSLQQLCHTVHIQQDPSATSTIGRIDDIFEDATNETVGIVMRGTSFYLLPAKRSTLALSRPLFSRFFTTS